MQLALLVDEAPDKALVKQLSGQLGSYLASCLLMVAYLSRALVGGLLSVAVSRRWFVASVINHDLDALDLFLRPCRSLLLHTRVLPKDLPAAGGGDGPKV